MAKDSNTIKCSGNVTKILPNLNFRVELDSGKEILAYISGKMRCFRIKVLVGDEVTVELPSKDAEKGRIVYRKS